MNRTNSQAANDNLLEAAQACVREPSDWEPGELRTLVRHLPTHTIFEFYPLSHKQPDDVLELADFRSRLVHVCEGHPPPGTTEHTRLCEEAVLMGLHYLGLVDFAAGGAAITDNDDAVPF
jgi:hypothetical protein